MWDDIAVHARVLLAEEVDLHRRLFKIFNRRRTGGSKGVVV